MCACVSLTLSLLSLSFSPILSHPLSLSALPSEFSEVVDLFTSCSVPLPPFPPELEMAGVTWLCLKWQRPTSSPKEDDIYYVLEMEEEGSVSFSVFLTSTPINETAGSAGFIIRVVSLLCEVLAAVGVSLCLRGQYFQVHLFDLSWSSDSMKYGQH